VIKLVTFLKRGAQLTRPEFVERWETVHAPLAAIFPGLRGYMLGFSVDEGEPPADGVAQLWFDSRLAAQASYASDIGRRGSADAGAYLSRREHLLASETWVTVPTPLSETPYKLLICFKRRTGASRSSFVDWLRNDAPQDVIAICKPDQMRVSVDEAGQLLNSGTEGSLELIEGEAVFDGFLELWFRELDMAREAREKTGIWSSGLLPSQASCIEDALLTEHIVVPPPASVCGETARGVAP
jgi:uncharacterized protein (TIGR02118 family)